MMLRKLTQTQVEQELVNLAAVIDQMQGLLTDARRKRERLREMMKKRKRRDTDAEYCARQRARAIDRYHGRTYDDDKAALPI